jgi:hypothetical protein
MGIDESDRLYLPMTRTVKAALLFFFLSLCASAMLVTYQIRSRTPPPAPRELFAVVQTQLASFRVADYSSAYQQAASGLQQRFTLPQFEAMIRHACGDLTSARHIEFGFVKINGPAAVVQVFVLEEGGWERSFFYSLMAEEGSWKISGVKEMGSAPPGHHRAGLHI